MEEVDREISEMKLSLNARARTVAESYLTAVRYPYMLPLFSADSFQYVVQLVMLLKTNGIFAFVLALFASSSVC